MVTGISFDFHVMSLTTVSESSQWWQSMSAVVIFGLLLATVLTLIVVPILYESIEKAKALIGKADS
jgi:multidrug efflux pump subunit AcrB